MKKKNMSLRCLLRIIVLTIVVIFAMSTCSDDVDNSHYYLNAPTGVVGTLLSDDKTIHLTWNSVERAVSYQIAVRTDKDSNDTRQNVTTTTVTSHTHSYYWWWVNTLDVNTLYYYIKAIPRSGSGYVAGDWSEPVPVTIR